MSLINEYIARMAQAGPNGINVLQQEISRQLNTISQLYDCYPIIFSSATIKNAGVADVSMNAGDFQVLYDMLRNVRHKRVLVYLETGGGCGQTAERIAKFLHSNFEEVHFLIAADCLSAGTILALSGHEILMAGSGSLGPIDAQVRTRRGYGSAYGYIKWLEELRGAVAKGKNMNAVDATILGNTSPAEIQSIHAAFNFAIDRVVEWLPKYKFKDWDKTDSNGTPVTMKMKQARAKEIADTLANQDKWLSHGTRLTIEDLSDLKIKILNVDNMSISDAVARINALLWLIYSNSPIYKVYGDIKNRVIRQVPQPQPSISPKAADALEFFLKCAKCHKEHRFFLRLANTDETLKALKKNTLPLFPKDNILNCDCGNVIDLSAERAKIINETGKFILDDQPQGAAK